jgi:hypothetical protein
MKVLWRYPAGNQRALAALLAACIAACAVSGNLFAQQAPPLGDPAAAPAQPLLPPQPAAPSQSASLPASNGPFAPGVLTTIAPDLQPQETVSTHDVIEIRVDPNVRWNPEPEYIAASRTVYGMSTNVKLRREVSCLEFSFKPLRMVQVDVPQPSGRMQRKLIWYMVYRVRNTGRVLKPVPKEAEAYAAEFAPGGPVQFMPHFVLEAQDRTATGEQVDKAYLDRVIPAAVEVIRQREMRGDIPLLNSIEMAEQPIPVSDGRVDRGVWGVATWEDVDPRIDFFSVFVGGLSNAYRWSDDPASARPGMMPGAGRSFSRKFLQLNFWVPGDEFLEDEREIRYGVPPGKADLYGVEEGVAYRWVYR